MRVQHSRPLVLVVFSLSIMATCVLIATGSETRPDGGEKPSFRERFDDPPGVPARPIPGVPPSAPVRFSSFVSIQANVGPGGINILGDAANEPSIAVDPTFPNRMAIGWRQFNTIASNFREAGWAYTADGGRSWTFPGVIEPGVFRSDPVLDSDPDGNFYFSSLRFQNPDYWCDVFKSWDGGMTWMQKAYAYGGDKQWITVDRTDGLGSGNIYQTWSIVAGCCPDSTFTRSVDGAARFQRPLEIPQHPIWGTMAVGRNGELYVAGMDVNITSRFLVAKSTNAFDPGQTPTFDFVTEVDLGGNVYYFGGIETPNPDGLLGQVNIAVDRSGGATDGYVYLCASVNVAGPDPLDVRFCRSTDGGQTFSAPVRLNDDSEITDFQWFGTMSVAPNGRIDVIWNDTRNDGVVNLSALYYTYSTNGGVSWAPNQQLSPVFDSHVGWPNQRKLGDYYDMVSDDVGAHVAWAATFNGEQDVYYLRIGDYDCNANGIGDQLDIAGGTSEDINGNGIPDECDDVAAAVQTADHGGYVLHQNVPNPFNPSTLIRFEVPGDGARVTLRVYDVAGRPIRTLADGYMAGGPNAVRWDGRDAGGRSVVTGLYFYRLEAPGFVETRKLLLIK